MISYLTILGAALAGFAGLEPWAVGAAAIALASLSHAEHSRLYERGQEMGLTRMLNMVMLRSLMNALVAAGGAYALGYVLRLLQ